MKYMLDTNICIYMIRNSHSAIVERIHQHMIDGLCISAITLSELMYGVENSSFPDRNRQALLQFLSIVEVLDFTQDVSIEYGRIRADLSKKGTPIGSMDMLIAAHALSEDLILVTNNTREFSRVRGLLLENWVE